MLRTVAMWNILLALLNISSNAYPQTVITSGKNTPTSKRHLRPSTLDNTPMLAIETTREVTKLAVETEQVSRTDPSVEDGRNKSRMEGELEKLREEVENMKLKMSRSSMYCAFLPENTCGSCTCVDDSRLLKKYYCDCRNIPAQKDCMEFRHNEYTTDGVYMVTQNNYKTIQVYCDQTTDDGGWTVFQRRLDGQVDFHRDWDEYKLGFGSLQYEHWLGLEDINTLLLHGLYNNGSELRIDLMNWDKKPKYAYYQNFQVANEFAKFELHVGGYNGTAGDAFQSHNKLDFTTIDRDHDLWTGGNCAQKYAGGWWYSGTSCIGGTTLNHHYYQLGESIAAWYGIVWTGINSASLSLKRTEMKFRRKL